MGTSLDILISPQHIKDVYKTLTFTTVCIHWSGGSSPEMDRPAISRNMYLRRGIWTRLWKPISRLGRKGLKTTYYLHTCNWAILPSKSTIRGHNKSGEIGKKGIRGFASLRTELTAAEGVVESMMSTADLPDPDERQWTATSLPRTVEHQRSIGSGAGSNDCLPRKLDQVPFFATAWPSRGFL